MELFVFGVNHKSAPVHVRERWALSEPQSRDRLESIRERLQPSEHLILSTCNRTEFYSRLPRDRSPLEGDTSEVRRALAEFYYSSPSAESQDLEHFYLYRDRAAVEHLFRLASGLDSMIVGESEILGQIKNAYAVSQEAQTAGDVFHRLFPAAISTGKRVRTQTEISKGCITPGQAALNVAIEALGDLSSRSVLLIGSGKIATITARALLESGISRFEISNRTHERAEELAGTLGDSSVDIKVTPWEELDMALARASVVITSTGSTEPLLTSERLEASQAKRHHEKQIIVDLAIPRDVAPESGDVEGIELFNIDDLNGVIQENIRQRHSHIPVAESIVREQIHTFVGRMSYFLQVEPVIRHMYERFEEIRLGALQSTVDGFPPELHEQVDQLTRNLVRKLIHFPISRLKALRDLGGLRDEEVLFLKKMFPTDPS